MNTEPTVEDLFPTHQELADLVAKVAGERSAALAQVAALRTDLRRMTDHAAALEAEVAALRAEVETLRQGWQAERDAATRAHDLLMAERAVRS